MFLENDTYVSVSCNDSGTVHEDGDEVHATVLGTCQLVPFVVSQSFEIEHNGEDAVIELNSNSVDESEPVLNYIFLQVVEAGPTLVTFNAPESRVCKISPTSLADAGNKHTVLQFHKTKFEAPQVQALSRSRCPIILDCSPITGLEDKLFLQGGIRVAFEGSAPKLSTLTQLVATNPCAGLMLKGIDFRDHYADGSDEQTVVDQVIHDANALVIECLKAECAILITGLKIGGRKITKNDITTDGAWAADGTVSIQEIRTISPIATQCVVQDDDVATIRLLPGNNLRFEMKQSAVSFVLPVGQTTKVLGTTVLGTTMKTLDDGHLQYTYDDETAKKVKVPKAATEKKWWCGTCAKTKNCSKHPAVN